jgi:hypothetical protein
VSTPMMCQMRGSCLWFGKPGLWSWVSENWWSCLSCRKPVHMLMVSGNRWTRSGGWVHRHPLLRGRSPISAGSDGKNRRFERVFVSRNWTSGRAGRVNWGVRRLRHRGLLGARHGSAFWERPQTHVARFQVIFPESPKITAGWALGRMRNASKSPKFWPISAIRRWFCDTLLGCHPEWCRFCGG